jgi:hypothetical protein
VGDLWSKRGQAAGHPRHRQGPRARSGAASPEGLADLKQGSIIQLTGKKRNWGVKAEKVLI